MEQEIQQIRVNAIAGRIAHESRIGRLRWQSATVDLLALAVPIGYAAIRLLARGTEYSDRAEHAWEITAAALLGLAIAKLVYRWPEKAEQHNRLVGENVSLTTQAGNLLRNIGKLREEEFRAFALYADTVEKSDREALGTISEKKRKEFFRNALREMGQDVKCPICCKSPWKFEPGTCQACGNKPERRAA